ncbi:MAG TPA: transglutaminase domain-containing protein, partial [Verrucomicrobiae bacterium]|nr:transglutaminase domain-containing protein [Verrucomicrobiae bacterium]
LGAALIFWGWQIELPAVGVALAIVLEGSRLLATRWDFSDDEFRRIWIFSCLVFVAALFYAFNANEGPAEFTRMFQDPNLASQTRAGTAGARTMISMIRWSPMIFFLFMAAQTYSTSLEVPVATVSIFMWRRRRRALKAGLPLAGEKKFNLSYPYFGTCLLAASIHTSEIDGYFWGFSALMAWALWSRRSRRLHPVAWALALAVVIALGDLGQNGLNRLQQFISNNSSQWLAQFFERGANPFQNATAIGDIGRLNASGNIVIRLETKPGKSPPLYLREASYRMYNNQIWLAGHKSLFDSISEEGTNSGNWVLVPGKTNNAEINIACYLPGSAALLPLPSGAGRLEHLSAYTLEKNPEGAIFARGPGLVIFDAHYGPGATMDSPVKDIDFDIPTNELPAIDTIVGELQVEGLSTKQKLERVQGFFQNNFTYSIWQDPAYSRHTNAATPLTQFLLQTHSGHCEYFATATVLLLRRMNVPARYGIGYVVHESKGNKYFVRQRDGHAWCLVWDEKTGLWDDFDTTPASRFAEEAKRASPFEFLLDAWSRVRFEIEKFWWGQSGIRKYVLWALIPILLLLLYQIIFRRSWRRRPRKSAARGELFDWPGTDSEFYQLERRLAGFIGARGLNETLGDWLGRAAKKPALRDILKSLQELLRLHYRYRFDPAGLIPEDRELLKQAVRECLRRLSEPELSHK